MLVVKRGEEQLKKIYKRKTRFLCWKKKKLLLLRRVKEEEKVEIFFFSKLVEWHTRRKEEGGPVEGTAVAAGTYLFVS